MVLVHEHTWTQYKVRAERSFIGAERTLGLVPSTPSTPSAPVDDDAACFRWMKDDGISVNLKDFYHLTAKEAREALGPISVYLWDMELARRGITWPGVRTLVRQRMVFI